MPVRDGNGFDEAMALLKCAGSERMVLGSRPRRLSEARFGHQ